MRFGRIFFFIGFLLLACGSVHGQTNGEAQLRYRQALEDFNARGLNSIDSFRQIVEDYPGTDSAALSLFTLGIYTEPEESLAAYQKLVSDYAGTDFEYQARLLIIEQHQEFNTDLERVEAKNQLATALGGPSWTEILNAADRATLTAQVHSLPMRTQTDLLIIYDSICVDIVSVLQDRKGSLPLALFERETFEISGAADKSLAHVVAYSLGLQAVRRDQISDPVVVFYYPTEGLVTGPSPEIRITITSGDKFHRQLDLRELQLTLDGQSIKQSTLVESAISQSREEGVPLETITLSYVPSSPLSSGTHTINLVAPIEHYSGEGPGETEASLNFTVSTSPPPVDDIVLDASIDTILSQRHQHENDGANALITLEKIQGKATRSAVAFNLSEVDLTGLSTATLILTIDPNQAVNGWGSGRTISAQALNSSWLEGNGKNFGLKKKDQVTGDGAGATWFSPSDEDISNDFANSAVSWNGAAYSAAPPTAPSVVISNGLSGEVAFDVTADLLNGAEHGWLILKDQENVGSKVSFYSREGAAAAGNPDLAPRLLLEFGQVASNSSEAQSETLLSRIGFGSIGTKLRPVSGSEVRSVKQLLQENRVAALAVEQLVSQATLTNPVANWTTRLAYRSWVSESLQIAANLEMVRS